MSDTKNASTIRLARSTTSTKAPRQASRLYDAEKVERRRRKRTYRRALEVALAVCGVAIAMAVIAMIGIAGSLETGRATMREFVPVVMGLALSLTIATVIAARITRALERTKTTAPKTRHMRRD